MARRRSYRRRFRSRFRRPHKQGLISKAINLTALAIGAAPVLTRAKTYLLDGGGDINGFFKTTSDVYSFGFTETGRFEMGRATEAIAPIVGAVIFKKLVGYLRRYAKI